MTNDDFGKFRSRFAGCEVVMLADISTMTILVSDSAIKLGQEHLDRLCTAASTIFAAEASKGVSVAFLTGPTGCTVFVRANHGVPEVLCGVFAPGADLSGVSEAARALLETADSEAVGE